jgi:hypothetical protein
MKEMETRRKSNEEGVVTGNEKVKSKVKTNGKMEEIRHLTI